MSFYRVDGSGVIIGGPFNCDQSFPVVQIADDDPRIAVFIGSITQNPLVEQAKIALDKSDITMLRCVESGTSVPAAWNTYRKSLRDIANGTDKTSTSLPEVPAYPAGT